MAARHRELQRYARFSAEDSARVVAMRALVTPELPAIAEIFYERIRESDEAHAVFHGEEQIVRLRGSLVRWMSDVFSGPHDDAHFAHAERIGQLHVHIRMPSRYLVSAMAVLRDQLTGRLLRAGHPEHAASVSRLLDVELAVMIDAYWEHDRARTRDLSKAARLATSASSSEAVAVGAEAATAIEGIAALVVGLDESGRIVLFNDEAERTLGYALEDVRGRPFAKLFPEESTEEARERFEAARHEEPSRTFDSVLVTRVGRMRDVRARFKWLHESTGGASCFLTAIDVTEERELAEQTRQTERLAAIGALAAGLAHEIRNPLNGAHLHLTLLDRLLRRGDAAEREEAIASVATVATEVQRLSALVTEFLQFARPQPLTLRPMALDEITRHATRILGPDAEREDVLLELDLPITPVHVRADRDKLSQVLLNLIRNAIEAIAADAEAHPRPVPHGCIIVRVRRHGREAYIEVEDDGPGFPMNDPRIFDAFFSTKPSGTGLGLPIAHRIVQDHGGAMSFESRSLVSSARDGRCRAHRTTFRITLPIFEPGEEPATAEPRGRAPGESPS